LTVGKLPESSRDLKRLVAKLPRRNVREEKDNWRRNTRPLSRQSEEKSEFSKEL
jgi:hypothetical protein